VYGAQLIAARLSCMSRLIGSELIVIVSNETIARIAGC